MHVPFPVSCFTPTFPSGGGLVVGGGGLGGGGGTLCILHGVL